MATTRTGTPGSRVGVRAVQGDVREHLAALRRCGAEACTVRRPAELDGVDALVLPGEESSAIDRLVRAFDQLGPCYVDASPRTCPSSVPARG